MKTINELCDTVRETAYAIHVFHGHGLLVNFGSYRFQIKKFVRRESAGAASALLAALTLGFSPLFAFLCG